MKPIECFLYELEETIYYKCVKMAIQTNWKVADIAAILEITEKQCDTRIYYGALRIAIKGGRSGLKAAYIDFLEDWIENKR